MLWRVATSFLFVLLVIAAVHAQDGQQPPPQLPGPPNASPPPPGDDDNDNDDDDDDDNNEQPNQPPPKTETPPLLTPPPGQDQPPGKEPPPGQEPPPEQEPPPGQTPPPGQDQPPPTQPPPNAQLQPALRCGAVAYTADGAFGGAYGITSCEEAERLAIDECRRESTDKADCSRGVIKGTDMWFLIQFCRGGGGGGHATHVSTGRTLAEVNSAAARYASTAPQGAQNCRMVPNGLFHSAGLHTKM